MNIHQAFWNMVDNGPLRGGAGGGRRATGGARRPCSRGTETASRLAGAAHSAQTGQKPVPGASQNLVNRGSCGYERSWGGVTLPRCATASNLPQPPRTNPCPMSLSAAGVIVMKDPPRNTATTPGRAAPATTGDRLAARRRNGVDGGVASLLQQRLSRRRRSAGRGAGPRAPRSRDGCGASHLVRRSPGAKSPLCIFISLLRRPLI